MSKGPWAEKHPGHRLAPIIGDLIHDSGYSRHAVARLSGVSRDTLGTWLSGARRLHQFILVDRVLGVLGYRLTIERIRVKQDRGLNETEADQLAALERQIAKLRLQGLKRLGAEHDDN